MPRLPEAKKDVVSCEKGKERNIDTLSSGERKGQSPNRHCYGNIGVVGLLKGVVGMNWNGLGRPGEEGDTPVEASSGNQEEYLSKAGHEESCLNLRRPFRKAKYSRKTDRGPVP